jgi:transposase-like protein
MKKPTKSKCSRQPRSPRASRKRRTTAADGIIELRREIREGLVSEIRSAVTKTAHQLVEDEVLELVGEPWSRKGNSPLRRNGQLTTTIFLDGEPHLLTRARVRDQDHGSEHPLQTVRALRSRDALDEEVKTRLIAGISTRNYESALTSLSDGLGLKKSAVSSAFQRASRKDLDALNGRSLSEWTFCAIYIDGTGFQDHTAVVALGVEKDGGKRILGVVEGASENTEVVRSLLENLIERGLTTTDRVLFVIDGSKALRKAIGDVFGTRAVIQRCVVHKLRNILSYLPPSRQVEARRRLKAAWGLVSHQDAVRELRKVQRWLAAFSEPAAGSLAEAFDETLTVHRLGVTGSLRQTLVTTNPIESALEIVKSNSRRVKRWNGSSMVLRWVGTGLVKAENQFRRVRGYAALPGLIAVLENESLSENKQPA